MFTKKKKVHPEFLYNTSDTRSLFRCSCGEVFPVTHRPGVMVGNKIKFCQYCGVEFDF